MVPVRLGALALASLLVTPACKREVAAPPRPTLEVELGPERTLAELGARLSAGAGGPGELVAAGTEQGVVLLLGGSAPAPLGETALHDGRVSALAFSADGRHLLSVGGKLCAWWSTARRALVRQVHGPQEITSAWLLERAGAPRAYFGTDHGAVVRWDPSQAKAEPLPRLACPAVALSPGQLAAPQAKRCPYGRFVPDPRGAGVCAYPVTAMAASGGRLAWACREGGLRLLELGSESLDGFSPGWLRTLTPLADGQVLAGRGEGQLRVYALAEKKLLRELTPEGAPEAAASAGELTAVAQPGAIRIWAGEAPRAVASAPSKARTVWLGLRRTSPTAAELRLLTVDGKLSLRPLVLRPVRP
jgi:hypothetical protein